MHDVYVEFTLPANGTIPLRVEGTYPLDVPAGQLSAHVLLGAPAPNPVLRGSEATISFTLPARADDLDLGVFDVKGRRVATLARGPVELGPHVERWNAAGFPAGLYFVRLRAFGAERVAKLALLP
jgi:hypothetical protein